MEAELKAFLSQRKKETIVEKTRTPSAVLLPLYKDAGKYHIVFIKRSFWVPTHQGQVAFPGGARHASDKSLLETALRETEEEIGVRRADVNVLGELDDQITTTSNFILTPFVDGLFMVPLHSLMDKTRLKPEMEILNGKEVPSFAYYYKGKRIWGATARVLHKFLDILEQIESPTSKKGD
jgi:8-oxo-dGTP pyrophosphatase MutT (NUDIX family)